MTTKKIGPFLLLTIVAVLHCERVNGRSGPPDPTGVGSVPSATLRSDPPENAPSTSGAPTASVDIHVKADGGELTSSRPQRHALGELSRVAEASVLRRRAEDFALRGFKGEVLAAFVTKLRRAVVQDDRVTVAKLVNYPLLLNANGRSSTVHNTNEFLAMYDTILADRTRLEIENTTVCNLEGVKQAITIGGGTIWIENLHGPRIVTINVPDAPAPPFVPGGCSGDALVDGVECIPECR